MASSPLFGGLPEELGDVAKHLGSTAAAMDLVAVAAKRVKDTAARYMDLADKIKALAAAGGSATAEMSALQVEFREAFVAMKNAASSASSLKSAHEALEKAVKDNVSTYEKFSKGVVKSQMEMAKWLPLFGGQAITLKGAKDALVKYNQSMFDLQRTYQVSSSGSQNFSKALIDVSKNTNLSTNQFLEFAKSVNSGWKGVLPGIDMIGKLASAFQDKLGPTIEATQEGLRSTMDLMEKLPALGKSTANAIIALNEGAAGSKEQAERQKGLISLMAITGKVSRQTLITQSKLLSGVTEEQEKQIDTNQELAKTVQKFEDTMLKLGQQLEPVLFGMTKALNGMMSVLQKMPAQIMVIGMAFKMMSKQMIGAGGAGTNALKGMTGATGAGGLINYGGGLAVRSGVGLNPMASTLGKGSRLLKGGGAGAAMGLVQGAIGGYDEYEERRAVGDKNAGKAALTKGAIIASSAAAGAAIGSIIPGLGTVLGGVVGGVIGGTAGSLGGTWLGDMVTDKLFPLEKLEDSERALTGINFGAKNVTDALKETTRQATELALSIMEAKENQQALFDTAMKTHDIFKREIELLSEVGLIDYDNTDKYFSKQLQSLVDAEKAAKQYFETLSGPSGLAAGLKQAGFDELAAKMISLKEAAGQNVDAKVFIDSTQYDQSLKAMEEEKSKVNIEVRAKQEKKKTTGMSDDEAKSVDAEYDASLVKQATLSEAIAEFSEKRLRILEKSAKIVDLLNESGNKAAEDARKYNSVYESRLDMEKQLMESAQFGMGASLDMMQKQIDMAHELIAVEKDRMDQQESRTKDLMRSKNLFTEAEIKSTLELLKASKSHMQTRKIINETAKGDSDVQRLLSKYAQDQQDASLKQMQQQKKIYDLTKDIREGYLDALREMSSGAGEFEKIIGTQTMGTSQLMDAVNNFTRTGMKNITNSGRLGGRQSKEQTKAGDGNFYMGQYTASLGALFQDKNMMDSGNKRYFRQKEAEDKFYAIQRGDQRATLGSANAMSLQDWYGDVERESSIDNATTPEGQITPEGQKQATKEGTKEGYIEAAKLLAQTKSRDNADLLRGVQHIWREPGGRHPSGLNERMKILDGVMYGTGVARLSKSSEKADPSNLIPRGGTVPYVEGEKWDGKRAKDLANFMTVMSKGFEDEMESVVGKENKSQFMDNLTSQLLRNNKSVGSVVKDIAKSYNIKDDDNLKWMRNFSQAYKDLYCELSLLHKNNPSRIYAEKMLDIDPSKVFKDPGGTTFVGADVPIQTKGFAKGGIMNGRSHANGGIRGTGSFAGIEVEGGEAIIPKKSVRNNRSLVNRLIHEGPSMKLADGTMNLDPSGQPIPDDSKAKEMADVLIKREAKTPAPAPAPAPAPTVRNVGDQYNLEIKLADEFMLALNTYDASMAAAREAQRSLEAERKKGSKANVLAPLQDELDMAKREIEETDKWLNDISKKRASSTVSAHGKRIMDSDNRFVSISKAIVDAEGDIQDKKDEMLGLIDKTDEDSLRAYAKLKDKRDGRVAELNKLKLDKLLVEWNGTETGFRTYNNDNVDVGGLKKLEDERDMLVAEIAESAFDAWGMPLSPRKQLRIDDLNKQIEIEKQKQKRQKTIVEQRVRHQRVRHQQATMDSLTKDLPSVGVDKEERGAQATMDSLTKDLPSVGVDKAKPKKEYISVAGFISDVSGMTAEETDEDVEAAEAADRKEGSPKSKEALRGAKFRQKLVRASGMTEEEADEEVSAAEEAHLKEMSLESEEALRGARGIQFLVEDRLYFSSPEAMEAMSKKIARAAGEWRDAHGQGNPEVFKSKQKALDEAKEEQKNVKEIVALAKTRAQAKVEKRMAQEERVRESIQKGLDFVDKVFSVIKESQKPTVEDQKPTVEEKKQDDAEKKPTAEEKEQYDAEKKQDDAERAKAINFGGLHFFALKPASEKKKRGGSRGGRVERMESGLAGPRPAHGSREGLTTLASGMESGLAGPRPAHGSREGLVTLEGKFPTALDWNRSQSGGGGGKNNSKDWRQYRQPNEPNQNQQLSEIYGMGGGSGGVGGTATIKIELGKGLDATVVNDQMKGVVWEISRAVDRKS